MPLTTNNLKFTIKQKTLNVLAFLLAVTVGSAQEIIEENKYDYSILVFSKSPSQWKETGLNGQYFKRATTAFDQYGKPFKNSTLKNKPSLLFFGFTNCPEICPTTLADLSEITREATSNIDAINIIFVTLDPKRDNEKHLKDYILYFDGNIIGVTGDKIEIKKFAENWKVFYETVKTSNNNYTLNHTATVFMIDKLGNFRGTISWGENESSIIQKINNYCYFIYRKFY